MAKVKNKKTKIKTHKCPKCGKKFADKGDLTHHIQLHSDDHPFTCSLCKASFKTKKYLAKHIRRVHSEPFENECKDCGKKFHYKSALQNHRLVHTDERPYKCKWCNKGFNSTYTLNNHIRIHTNSKPYKCSYCDYACRDGSTLRRHEGRHRGQVSSYICKICDKNFCQKRLLRLHVREQHLHINVNLKPCDTCGKMFRDNTSLKTHINRVHKRLHAIKCTVCDTTVSSKYALENHLRTHIDERPFCCRFDGCGKSFKDPSTLKKHDFIHYPDKHFKCKLCDRRFARRNRLEKHKLQHIAKKKSVICDYCNVSFYNKKYLTNHIVTKHLYKVNYTYICDLCNMVLYSKPSLINHLKRHNNDKDTQCKICKKTYKKHEYLKLHYWNTHCIKYKRREKKVKRTPILQEIDGEKLIVKAELMSESEEETETVLAEDLKTSENNLSAFYETRTMYRNKTPKKPQDPRIDKKIEGTVQKKIKVLLEKSRRTSERRDLERARQIYNKRMKVLMKNRKEEQNTEVMKTEVGKMTCKKDENGKWKFNAHQCYVCFTLYKTKEELLDHCQQHFDICNATMLRKCPLCEHVSKKSLGTHLLKIHKIKTKLYTGNIESDGSKYYFNVNNKRIKKVEVIPSVKLLNRRAYVKLDKINRETKDKMISKTKLVRKGAEWIVEKEKLNVENYKIPKLCEIKSNFNVGDDYCTRMKSLSVAAKQNGGKMLYPCDKCEKICQTMSALKLHYRRHDPNAKPYKPKTWKHKLKFNNKEINDKSDAVCDTSKRYVKPKPITNKHKCDPKLMKFYETHIRGDNIEFWQFLKIYNRMTKEKIEDFSDLQNRTDFNTNIVTGTNTDNLDMAKKKTEDNKKISKFKKMKVLRRILISKKEHKRRNEIKKTLRDRIAKIVC